MNDLAMTLTWLSRMYREAPIGLCFLDRELRYVFINEWLAKINGTSVEGHLGRTVSEVLPDVAATAESQLRHVLETGEPIIDGIIEAETPSAPGQKRVFQHNYNAVVGDDGTVVGVSCAVQDVTERRRGVEAIQRDQVELENRVRERTADLLQSTGRLEREIEDRKRIEKALKASQATYRSLVESTNVIPWKLDWPSGRFTYVGQQIESVLGYPAESWIGASTWAERIHPDDREIATQFCNACTAKGEDHDFEYRAIAADGRYVWIRDVVSVIMADDGPSELVGFMFDVSKHRRAEEALRDTELQFRQLAENIHQVFWLTDWVEKKLIYVSPAYESVFGRSCESLYANRHGWIDDIHPEEKERVTKSFARAAERGEDVEEEYRLVRPDGTERWICDRAFPVRDDLGRVYRIVGLAEDITERKRADAERRRLEEGLRHAQKLEAVGTLAAGMAHEINNMLTSVTANTEMVRILSRRGADLTSVLDGIEKATKRVTRITRSLLTFSRKSPPRMTPIDLRAFASDAIGDLRRMMPGAIEIAMETSEQDDLWIDADEVEIQQILVNLVINARDAMPDGGRIEILIDHLRDNQTRKWSAVANPEYGVAVMTICDSGVGMSEEVRRKIFEPFFTTKSRGHGLGMAVVHGIVTAHGGQMIVESTQGSGTRVSVAFPACEPGTFVEQHRPPEVKTCGSGERILVVEDNAEVLSSVATALEAAGFRVVQASDGAEGLTRFAEFESSLRAVIFDDDLPIMSGRKCLRKIHSQCRSMPAVLMSGLTPESCGEQSEDGIVFVRKPFGMSELVSTIAELIKSPDHGSDSAASA